MELTKIIIGIFPIFLFLIVTPLVSGEVWVTVDSLVITDETDSTNLIFLNDTIQVNLSSYWKTDSNIVSGLGDIGSYSAPTVFQKNSIWYLISGNNTGLFDGYNWTGSIWQVDPNIVSGLTDVGINSKPTVFEKDSIWYLISGDHDGRFKGFNWTGSAWQSDPGITSGLPADIGYGSAPFVFEKNSIWYLMSGHHDGHYLGYNWTGSAWQSDSGIINGLPDVGFDSSITGIQLGEISYLILGANGGSYYGYIYKNSIWKLDNSIKSGIIPNGTRSSPSTFTKNQTHYCITGTQTGYFDGYQEKIETYTNWTASAVGTEVIFSFNDFNVSNTTVTNFTIHSGTLDWLRCTDLNIGEYYGLYDSEDTLLEMQYVDNSITFNTNLITGNYRITSFDYGVTTGIHGFISEGNILDYIVLPDTTINIYNASWSAITVSDAAGYYKFLNLSNTTYTLSFRKDRYDEILFQYTTPQNGSMYRKDIFLIRSTGQYYSRHYCTFTLKNIFGAHYSNVDTVVYDNGAIEATGRSGTDGAVTFHLFEDVEYRITFINASQGISESITLTPRDNAYIVYVTLLDFSLDDSATVWASVDYHWSKNRINNSHGWINFTYTDRDNSTWEVEYFINRSVNNSHNEPVYYFISSQNGTWVANSSYTVSTIVPADNATFVCHFSADNPNLPSLSGSGSAVINFVQGVRVNLGWEDTWKYNTVGICIIIFIGLLFGAANAHIGAVVCVMTGWFLWYIKWLTPPEISFVALALATVLSILFVMRKGESLKA